MLDLTQMGSWTPPQTEAAIQELLPLGWTFVCGLAEDRFQAMFKNEKGEEVWSDLHYDARNLLLTAYTWLYQRRSPLTRGYNWTRRASPEASYVPGVVTLPGISVLDPEDLIPGEIASVYAGAGKKT